MTSTQQGLIDRINRQAEAIQSLKATVDIDSSVGGMKKGHVTDYKEIQRLSCWRESRARCI